MMSKVSEEIAKKLMNQNGLNDDWYYDNRLVLAEAEEVCQEFEVRADQILDIPGLVVLPEDAQ